MFCSHCGATLLAGSNQCLHCGRITASVPVDVPRRPTMPVERPRRRRAWMVGVLLVLVNAVLAVGVGMQALVPLAVPSPTPAAGKPVHPPTVGLVPPLERGPSEAWSVALADLRPEGSAAPVFVYPGEYDERYADLAVVVSAAADKTYVRALSLSNGATAWIRPLAGRAACGFDRDAGLWCFSSTLEVTRLGLVDGAVVGRHVGRVEAPARVWVSASGGVFVLAVADPGGDGVRELGVTLTRVDGAGGTLWTQTARLAAGPGRTARLHGTASLVAVSTVAPGADGAADERTPAMVRTQDSGARVGSLVDGADVTVLPDGRLGVATGTNASTLFDASGKELFPVKARLVGGVARDVAAERVPTLAVVRASGSTPQPPTLIAVQANGSASALGQGTPLAVCGGLLIAEDAVSATPAFTAQELEKGAQVWQVPHAGVQLASACDGKRFVAWTSEGGVPVAHGYALTTGDPVWRVEFRDREFHSDVPGRGWFVFDAREQRLVLVRA